MNKVNARKLALAGGVAVRELRTLIANKRGHGGMSVVNPSIPLDRALSIYDAALAARPDDEKLKGEVPDVYRPGRMVATRDVLIVTNILRDCG